jgi:hypothetical protein
MASIGVADSMRAAGLQDINAFRASGMTPLYLTVNASANLLGSGTTAEPNIIIAFSDGYNNFPNGYWSSVSAGTVGANIAAAHPNLKVHTIDLINNTSGLKPLSDATGGFYAKANNAAELQAILDLLVLGCGP